MEVASEPGENSATNGNTAGHEEIKMENGLLEQTRLPDHDQQPFNSGQNGNIGPSWNDGPGGGGQGNNYGDVAVEPEQHGIGIKEDG